MARLNDEEIDKRLAGLEGWSRSGDAISKTYGIRLKSDDENNARIFSSLRSLNEHIRKLQTK